MKQYKNTVQTIQKHSKCKYTYYQNTHTYTHTTHYKSHALQNQLKQPQYKIHTRWNSHNTGTSLTLDCFVPTLILHINQSYIHKITHWFKDDYNRFQYSNILYIGN